MKKIMLMAVVLLSSVAASAQHAVGSFTLQPKVGMNVANLTELDNADSRIGLAAGAELEYQVSDIFSLSGGAIYSMQGSKYDRTILKQNIKTTTKLDYINVPIMANVYVVKGLAVKLGIQPGFNVNSKQTFSGKTVIGDVDEKAELDAKSVDFSIPVGLSYEYNNVVLDARYNWGLTKVFDGSDAKNSVFQITLGYKFDL
ncbi:porin family protein [Prevotella sp. kh1p2]|uniref:porin family protein n=1 Tax=Prevotella sp. kh1p2 TaxID=1761883 RepID=UPI0008BA7FF3|nr:porin family protein [Prevotella sp. kh1p2]SET13065.1 Outer membrane protein beta-barrel domain-containing protein [Prevotella sp. kh1p2]SNU11932.1 Outer membrane protein beta-barrel domain-containing protein [Prevotellaceae bacterium KH2P17]